MNAPDLFHQPKYTGVRTTSLLAYEEAKININEKQEKVLNAIKQLGQCSDVQIAQYLGWTINRITNRRGELVKFGKIYMAGKVKNSGGL